VLCCDPSAIVLTIAASGGLFGDGAAEALVLICRRRHPRMHDLCQRTIDSGPPSGYTLRKYGGGLLRLNIKSRPAPDEGDLCSRTEASRGLYLMQTSPIRDVSQDVLKPLCARCDAPMTIKTIAPLMSGQTIDEIGYRCPVCGAKLKRTVEKGT